MEHRDLYQNERTSPLKVKYAGFMERLVAHIIDGIILSFGLGVISFATGMSFTAGWVKVVYSPGSWLAMIFVAAYYIYFETSDKQATLGKQILNIKVVKQDGTKIETSDAIFRYFGKIISAVIFMLGYLMALFDDQKRALHDRIAKTYVVKV